MLRSFTVPLKFAKVSASDSRLTQCYASSVEFRIRNGAPVEFELSTEDVELVVSFR